MNHGLGFLVSPEVISVSTQLFKMTRDRELSLSVLPNNILGNHIENDCLQVQSRPNIFDGGKCLNKCTWLLAICQVTGNLSITCEYKDNISTNYLLKRLVMQTVSVKTKQVH